MEVSGTVDSSLNVNETGTQLPAKNVPHETIPVSVPAGIQPNVKAEPQGFDYDWWKKDQRFGKIWKSDRDVIKSAYESDKILETKYKPAYKQYEDLKNRIKELGYDPEKTDDFINEFKSWKDPDNPVVSLGNYLMQWKDDPMIGDIDKFFNDLNIKKMQRDFPGWTSEGVQKFQQVQSEVQALKQEKEAQRQAELKQKESEVVGRIQQEIDVEMLRIEEECKNLGFEFTKEIRDKLYDYGVKESLNPKHLNYAFKELFKDDISKLSENKLKSKIMQDKQAKFKTKVPYVSTKTNSPIKKSFQDRLESALKTEVNKTGG